MTDDICCYMSCACDKLINSKQKQVNKNQEN